MTLPITVYRFVADAALSGVEPGVVVDDVDGVVGRVVPGVDVGTIGSPARRSQPVAAKVSVASSNATAAGRRWAFFCIRAPSSKGGKNTAAEYGKGCALHSH